MNKSYFEAGMKSVLLPDPSTAKIISSLKLVASRSNHFQVDFQPATTQEDEEIADAYATNKEIVKNKIVIETETSPAS